MYITVKTFDAFTKTEHEIQQIAKGISFRRGKTTLLQIHITVCSCSMMHFNVHLFKKTRVHSFHCFHSYKKTHREISTTKNPRAHGETYSINRTTFHTHTHARNRGRPRFETWDLEDVPEVGVLGGKMTIRGEEVYNDEVVGCLVVWRVVSNSLSSG